MMEYNDPMRVLLRSTQRRVSELEAELSDAAKRIEILERDCGAGLSVCDRCHCVIDPDTCHCGEAHNAHAHFSDHAFVPMGCLCGYARVGDEDVFPERALTSTSQRQRREACESDDRWRAAYIAVIVLLLLAAVVTAWLQR